MNFGNMQDEIEKITFTFIEDKINEYINRFQDSDKHGYELADFMGWLRNDREKRIKERKRQRAELNKILIKQGHEPLPEE